MTDPVPNQEAVLCRIQNIAIIITAGAIVILAPGNWKWAFVTILMFYMPKDQRP